MNKNMKILFWVVLSLSTYHASNAAGYVFSAAQIKDLVELRQAFVSLDASEIAARSSSSNVAIEIENNSRYWKSFVADAKANDLYITSFEISPRLPDESGYSLKIIFSYLGDSGGQKDILTMTFLIKETEKGFRLIN